MRLTVRFLRFEYADVPPYAPNRDVQYEVGGVVARGAERVTEAGRYERRWCDAAEPLSVGPLRTWCTG